MAVFGPALHSADKWAEMNEFKTGTGAMFIRGFSQTGQLVNEWMIPSAWCTTSTWSCLIRRWIQPRRRPPLG